MKEEESNWVGYIVAFAIIVAIGYFLSTCF